MKFLYKYSKGQYEFAQFSKKKIGIYTLCLYLLSAAIYITGYVTTGSNKNLLTIVAVLGILPASKMLISFIMNMRVKTVPVELKNEIDEKSQQMAGFYHMMFTSYDTNYRIDHCIVTSDSLIGYSSDKDFDEKKFNEHIDKHMKIDGISGVMIKIFNSKDAYINRLSQLSDSDTISKPNKQMIELITSITV